jgi:hypothetical protein
MLLLHVSALQGRHLQGAPKDTDEIVHMLRHKCRISEGRGWITVCVLSAEGTRSLQACIDARRHHFRLSYVDGDFPNTLYI